MATSGAPRTAAATTISSSSPSYASVAAAAAVRGASGTLPDPNAHKTGPDRILIPISQVGRRSVTLSSDSASTRSILSHESTSSSVASVDLPAFRSVQRSHFFQFCATVVFLFVLPLALLVAYKREFRSDAFAIGVAAWLASETLRQVVFDLVTPAAARHRVPAAEFENLVLDDDLRHDLTSPSHSHAHHHEDDAFEAQRPHSAAAPLPSGPGAAIPTLIYSIAQEALRLGAVAVIVRLLPTQVLLAASPLLSVAPSTEERHYIPVPPPSHPRAGDPGRPSHGSLPPLDPLFWSALWLALGWAGAEILWGSRRLWTQLELYRDVLPLYPEEDDDEARRLLLHRGEREVLLGVPTADPEHGYYGATADGGPARATAGAGQEQSANWHSSRDDWHSKAPRSPAAEFDSRDGQDADDAEEEEEEDDEDGDFEYRVREAQRDELEEQLGVPLYEVPVGIIFIWRLDSLLLSLVFTLFLALPFRLSPPSLFHFPLYPTFALVAIAHALLSYAWVARVRKVGIPSISYASLIVLVALTFAALGSWGVLV